MTVDRPLAKQAARNCMRTARVSPYQISLLLVVITIAMSAFEQFMINLFGIPYYVEYGGYYITTLMPSSINWFITIMVSLLSTVLRAGFVLYCLGVRRGKEMPLTTLFDGFSIAGKVILLEIVTSIFVFLWALLLVIPGIIAMYRYRFALYNLLENPDMGILEAINLSKAQTYGYKWQLFVLDLSFLGWIFLSFFTFGLLYIWLGPYMRLTDIAFYDTIRAQKGMSGSGGQQNWQPPHNGGPTPGQYDYDWNHSGSSWSSAPQNGAQTQTPPQNGTLPPQEPGGEAPSQPAERRSDHQDS